MTEGIRIPATGNGMKHSDQWDTFLEVSGGFGNHGYDEIHLRIWDNAAIRGRDDGTFAQAWFKISDLLAAIDMAREDKED